MSSKYVLSLGSNCEVGMMINRKYNNIYSNLFNWTNITIDNLILILNNLENLCNNDNVEFIYRLFCGESNVYSSKNIYDVKKYYLDNPNNYKSIHLDYEFYIDKKYIFWSHGIIEENIDKIINCDLDSLENYKSSILSKFEHLAKNTISILNNNTDIIKIYIKCLKNEYSLESFTNLENLFMNRPNIYIGIIYESDEDINIEIKNTNLVLVRLNKLTGHNEAIYSELYSTQEKYFYLFETLDKLSNS